MAKLLTTLQQLERLQKIICEVEAGNSFSVDGINYTAANLATLYQREEMLYKRLSMRNLRKSVLPELG